MEDPTRERSPSPEPTYDQMGKRTNTRDQRVKDKLMRERQNLVAEAMAMNPLFRVFILFDFDPLQRGE